MFILFFILAFFLSGCDQPQPPFSQAGWQEISSRPDHSSVERFPLYQVKVPSKWIRREVTPSESLIDTTKAIGEFYIEEGDASIRITIHNFPSNETAKIPPSAQIQRWKKQFDDLDLTQTYTLQQSHNGFIGLYLEAQGLLDHKPAKLLGWSMQLAPEYDRQLAVENNSINKHKRADYTIKAVGPIELMNKHEKSIKFFATSLELIDQLPSPL